MYIHIESIQEKQVPHVLNYKEIQVTNFQNFLFFFFCQPFNLWQRSIFEELGILLDLYTYTYPTAKICIGLRLHW